MSGRDKILLRIRQLGLTESPMPLIPDFSGSKPAALENFIQALRQARARVVEWEGGSLDEFLSKELPGRRWSCVDEVKGDESLAGLQDPRKLDGVEVAVMRAAFGVAENGAMWIREQDLTMPAVPFIVQHLVILISRNELVPDMHAAYARIRLGEYPFGVFIAGPSKTADIEQSMVIGAHGPLGMTVVVS